MGKKSTTTWSIDDLVKRGFIKDKDGNYRPPTQEERMRNAVAPQNDESYKKAVGKLMNKGKEILEKSGNKVDDRVVGETKPVRVELKPMSVNNAWKGRRVKSNEYKLYEQSVKSMLPDMAVPAPPLKVSFIFGFSNAASDLDNPVKCFIDILQSHYSFNDRDVYELSVRKVLVPARREYCEFKIETIPLPSI